MEITSSSIRFGLEAKPKLIWTVSITGYLPERGTLPWCMQRE
ncbi:MAG: hypothetical protein SGI86_19935 [Deltaproteobacteria bacterium]|nr:hypothetical protein [Deltaproteobacteria bacterium]